MTIKTGGRFRAIANCLRMEAVIVTSVRRDVKKRARQIWKLLARAMTSLALKCRGRSRRSGRVWTADNRAFVWPERRR